MGTKEYIEYIDKFYDDIISKDKTYNIDRETIRKLIMLYELDCQYDTRNSFWRFK